MDRPRWPHLCVSCTRQRNRAPEFFDPQARVDVRSLHVAAVGGRVAQSGDRYCPPDFSLTRHHYRLSPPATPVFDASRTLSNRLCNDSGGLDKTSGHQDRARNNKSHLRTVTRHPLVFAGQHASKLTLTTSDVGNCQLDDISHPEPPKKNHVGECRMSVQGVGCVRTGYLSARALAGAVHPDLLRRHRDHRPYF